MITTSRDMTTGCLTDSLLRIGGTSMSTDRGALAFMRHATYIRYTLRLGPARRKAVGTTAVALYGLSKITRNGSIGAANSCGTLMTPRALATKAIFVRIAVDSKEDSRCMLPRSIRLGRKCVFPISMRMAPSKLRMTFKAPVG